MIKYQPFNLDPSRSEIYSKIPARTPKYLARRRLFSATTLSASNGSVRPYAVMHSSHLALESVRSAAILAGNPRGGATAGGIIGAAMVSVGILAEPFEARALASTSASSRAFTGCNAVAMAPANHGGAISAPAKCWII